MVPFLLAQLDNAPFGWLILSSADGSLFLGCITYDSRRRTIQIPIRKESTSTSLRQAHPWADLHVARMNESFVRVSFFWSFARKQLRKHLRINIPTGIWRVWSTYQLSCAVDFPLVSQAAGGRWLTQWLHVLRPASRECSSPAPTRACPTLAPWSQACRLV